MKTQAILFLLSILLVTACKKSPTGGGDTTPPEVVQTSPENKVSDVSVDTDINVSFNEEIDRDSFSLSVQDSTGNEIEVSSQFEKSKVTTSLEGSFNFSTEYIASVTARDLDGNKMDEPYSWSFITESDTTSPEVDNTPPNVMSIYPEDESTGVSVNTDIQVEFSEKVNSSTVSFELENIADNSLVTGDITSEDNTYTFNPNSSLDYGIDYQVSVTASDTAGNEMSEAYTSTFKTEEDPDEEAPVVRDTDPRDEESDISVTTTVRVEFNEQITDELTFSLESSSGEVVEGDGEIDVNIFTFTLSDPLEPSTNYEASISAVDLAGNGMEESYSWNFTTEDEDNTPPEVISTNPENEDIDVSVDTDISISFNEYIDGNDSELTLSSGSDENVEGNLSFNDDAINFTPSNSLDYSKEYQVQVRTVDLNGNETSHSWSFTTADDPDNTPPEVTSTTPEDNATNVSIDADISINLNESIDSESSQLQLKIDGQNVAGNMSFSESSISFNPDNSLEYSQDYYIQAVATDLVGNETEHNWNFKTEDNPDNTPPTVTSTSPYNGELDVSLNSITINMSEDINPESVSSDNVWVENDEGEHLDYEIIVEEDLIKLDLLNTSHNNDVIKPSSRYFAHIEEVEDFAGNSLQGSYEWDFVNQAWNVDGDVYGAVSDNNNVYLNGSFTKDENYIGFFVVAFDHSGVIEWRVDLTGKTSEGSRNLVPSLAINRDLNELYFFSERDKTVYFNRMDLSTQNITSQSVPGPESLEKVDDLVIDNNNDLYFLVTYNQFSTGRILQKIDRNGNKLDEFDFSNSPANSLTTNGSSLFVVTEHNGSNTIAKFDAATLDLIGLLDPDEDELFPEDIRAVDAVYGTDTQHILGTYDDKPMLYINDPTGSNGAVIEFGTVYDKVTYDIDVDSNGNSYIVSDTPESYDLIKASKDGVHWRKSFNVSLATETYLLEEAGLILVSDGFFNRDIKLFSLSNGERVN